MALLLGPMERQDVDLVSIPSHPSRDWSLPQDMLRTDGFPHGLDRLGIPQRSLCMHSSQFLLGHDCQGNLSESPCRLVNSWHADLQYCIRWLTCCRFSNAAFNIITDICTTILPLPILNTLRIPKKQKYLLMLVFGLGGITCIISILRLQSLYVISKSTDVSWDNPLAAIWSSMEVNVGIICSVSSISCTLQMNSTDQLSVFPPSRDCSLAYFHALQLERATSALEIHTWVHQSKAVLTPSTSTSSDTRLQTRTSRRPRREPPQSTRWATRASAMSRIQGDTAPCYHHQRIERPCRHRPKWPSSCRTGWARRSVMFVPIRSRPLTRRQRLTRSRRRTTIRQGVTARVQWACTRLRNLEAMALDGRVRLYVLRCRTLTIEFMCLRYPNSVIRSKLIIELLRLPDSGKPESGLR